MNDHYSRTVLAQALVLTMGFGALAGCASSSPATEIEEAGFVLAPTDVAVAAVGTIRSTVVLTGPLVPFQTVDVKAQVPGTIAELLVSEGDRVAAGTVIARVEAAGIRGDAEGAEAGVAVAQGSLAQATRELESARTLHEAGAMSALEFQAIQTGHEAADAQLITAQARAIGASEQASRTVVRAPLSGRVSERSVDEGEAVSVGQSLYTVVNSSELELRGQVPVVQATRVAEGQEVEFSLDGYPGESFRGTVFRVAPVADPATHQVRVTVRLPNPDGALIGGLFATGEIIIDVTEELVVIPAVAVRGASPDAFVWVIDSGFLGRRPVTVGPRDESEGVVAIFDGLEAGELVVVSPGEAVEGTPVRIRNTDAPEEGS